MKKLLSVLVMLILGLISVLPTADAAVRLRRQTPRVQVQQPYYSQQPQYYIPQYQTPQNTGNLYYFSTTPQAGYTYYSTPLPGYYYYGSTPVQAQSVIEQGRYYFSTSYVAGYTYYPTPTPGYYYYLGKTSVNPNTYSPTYTYNPLYNSGNTICVIINGGYQCTNNTTVPNGSTYPGCASQDILIGGQIWASCNVTDLRGASAGRSGWFFAGDTQSSFVSNNGTSSALEWMGSQTQTKSWNNGPCASGYRLPTRGEWETVQSYARANSTTIASMLSLPQNGGYQATRNTNGDVVISGRLSVGGSYWTSTYSGVNPIVMHIGSTYAGYNTTATEYGYVNNNGYQWTYTDTGLELIASTTGELANVRCIRN